MCNLLIFGATRNTGLYLAQYAQVQGLKIAAMVREGSDVTELAKTGARLIDGDAFNRIDCENALALSRPEFVVSVLGGKNAEGRRVDATGNINLMDAMLKISPESHFIFLTSRGCGEEYAALNDHVKQMLGEALRAKTEAEEYLQQSQLNWTIVRPGGLNHDLPTKRYALKSATEKTSAGYMSRFDVALALLDIVNDPVQYQKMKMRIDINQED